MNEVEKRIEGHKARSPGQYIDRELVLKMVIGERALEKAGAAGTRAKKKGQASIERQRAAGGGGRGDVGETRARGGKSVVDRLRGVKI
jgi:hypothetical protein